MSTSISDNIKAIIFDYDDTLVKTREIKWNAIKETARRYYGQEIDNDHISKYWGLPFEQMLSGALKNIDTFNRLRDKYYLVTTEFPMEAHKGSLELIDKLAGKYLIGIVTASNEKLVIDDLTRLGFPLSKFFDIQTAEDTPVHKPNPKVFDPILRKLMIQRIGPKSVLYIGDGLKDFYAARDAGMSFLGITHGTTIKEEFEREGADAVASFRELFKL